MYTLFTVDTNKYTEHTSTLGADEYNGHIGVHWAHTLPQIQMSTLGADEYNGHIGVHWAHTQCPRFT